MKQIHIIQFAIGTLLSGMGIPCEAEEIPVSVRLPYGQYFVIESVYQRGSQVRVQLGLRYETGLFPGLDVWNNTTYDLNVPSIAILFTFNPPAETDTVLDQDNLVYAIDPDNRVVRPYDFAGDFLVYDNRWAHSADLGWVYFHDISGIYDLRGMLAYGRWCYTEQAGWFFNISKYVPMPDYRWPTEWGNPLP